MSKESASSKRRIPWDRLGPLVRCIAYWPQRGKNRHEVAINVDLVAIAEPNEDGTMSVIASNGLPLVVVEPKATALTNLVRDYYEERGIIPAQRAARSRR